MSFCRGNCLLQACSLKEPDRGMGEGDIQPHQGRRCSDVKVKASLSVGLSESFTQSSAVGVENPGGK